jgi:hypothetical protein
MKGGCMIGVYHILKHSGHSYQGTGAPPPPHPTPASMLYLGAQRGFISKVVLGLKLGMSEALSNIRIPHHTKNVCIQHTK